MKNIYEEIVKSKDMFTKKDRQANFEDRKRYVEQVMDEALGSNPDTNVYKSLPLNY